MWNYEGFEVEGLYMGDIPVSGTVYLSRVKYGGGVSHHVDLSEEINVFGEMRDSVILDHKDIQKIKGTKLMK